jgi:hypothetical protein
LRRSVCPACGRAFALMRSQFGIHTIHFSLSLLARNRGLVFLLLTSPVSVTPAWFVHT